MKEQKQIFLPQVACPSCGNLSPIDYCEFGYTYTWWCNNDDCGKQYRFIINKNWTVKSEPTGLVVTRTAVTLKVRRDKDIFITLKGRSFSGETFEESIESDKYFYNQGTCPVNLIKDGLEVRVEDNRDPHGVFEYIKTESLEDFYNEMEED